MSRALTDPRPVASTARATASFFRAGRDALDLGHEAEVGRDRHLGIEGRGLGQVSDDLLDLVRPLEDVDSPATTAFPSVAGRYPVRIRMVVVLPAALGPRSPQIMPFLDLEADALDRREVPVFLDEIGNFDHGASMLFENSGPARGVSRLGRGGETVHILSGSGMPMRERAFSSVFRVRDSVRALIALSSGFSSARTG